MVDSYSVSCFAPMVVVNPKYRRYTDKEKRIFQAFYDDYFLRVPCGKCYLCRKKKANSWRIRLVEELKVTPTFYEDGVLKYRCIFVCFTFDNVHLPDDKRESIAYLVRKWRDLWRKHYGKSPRYFATTDKGSQFARLHLHLLIFNPYDCKNNRPVDIPELELFDFFWRNGFVRYPSWLEGLQGITYVTSYITGGNLEADAQKHGNPICEEAKQYIPFVFVSNGLGKNFVTDAEIRSRNHNEDTTYNLGGFEYALPLYYRNKIFDTYTRWMMNKIHQYEMQDYVLNAGLADNLRWKLQGVYYNSPERVEDVYNAVYAQFDKYPKFNV